MRSHLRYLKTTDVLVHLTITYILTIINIVPPEEHKKISYRKICDIDIDALRSDIKNSDLNSGTTGSLDDIVSKYNTTLRHILDKHAPVNVRTLKPRTRQPWYKDSLRTLKHISRRKERAFRKTSKSDLHYEQIRSDFKIAQEQYFKSVENMKSDYYKELVLANKNDQGKLYRVLNDMMGKRKDNPLPKHCSKIDLANSFGQYFKNKIDKIRESFTDSGDAYEFDTSEGLDSSFSCFDGLSLQEVKNMISVSSSKTSPLDPIPTSLIKQCSDELAPIISKIINSSLSSSHFPSAFKEAIVTPLLKKPTLQKIPKNYRPVSNLSYISKLTEKAASSQLDKYIDDYHLDEPMQSGYRKGCGTETALVRIFEEILMAMDNKEVVFLCLLDNSAAFDTVDIDIHITRLEQSFGVIGAAKDWFKSYFDKRSQRIKIDDVLSEPVELTCGVPQGSMYGAKAYKQYTRPAGPVLSPHNLFYSFYADDGQVLKSAPADSLQRQLTAVTALKDGVESLGDWMTRNKLKLNQDKTQFMVLGSKRAVSNCPIKSIELGSEVIEKCDVAVNLGINMDAELRMSQHINAICRKCYQSIRIISRIRSSLDVDSAKTLVQAFIISKIDYGNVLLYGVNSGDLAKLQKIMNAAARLITRTCSREHITPVLKSLHWLKIKERIEYKIALLVFKSIHNQGPEYLQSLLKLYVPPRTLRSEHALLLVEPKYKLERCGRRAFSRCGPSIWNSLPYSVRSSINLEQFKKRLKTFLFSKSYP